MYRNTMLPTGQDFWLALDVHVEMFQSLMPRVVTITTCYNL